LDSTKEWPNDREEKQFFGSLLQGLACMYMPCLFSSSTDQLNNVLTLWRQKTHVLRRRVMISIPENQSKSIDQLWSFLYISTEDFTILLLRTRVTITKFKSRKFVSENLQNELGIKFNQLLIQQINYN
jgi:hypothetical protein